jgi:hypothetical protein
MAEWNGRSLTDNAPNVMFTIARRTRLSGLALAKSRLQQSLRAKGERELVSVAIDHRSRYDGRVREHLTACQTAHSPDNLPHHRR